MSTEYFLVAEKDGDICIFDHLYKMQGFIGAVGKDVESKIEEFMAEYINVDRNEIPLENRRNMDEKMISLAFHMINFLYKYSGYNIHFLDDNQIIEFLYRFDKSKYPSEFWTQFKYYEPRY